MTQTIEQLQAKVAELEEEKKELQALLDFDNARLDQIEDELEDVEYLGPYVEGIKVLKKQLAAEQLNNKLLREIIEKLWVVIDDIDTYSDMAKADDKLYRSLVERRQKDRWGTRINCDGHKLEFPTQFTPTALEADSATAWAQAHRLALELECLLLSCKDTASVSAWWDSAHEALEAFQNVGREVACN